ncbi:MAG: hypothetical protein PHP82_00200 [Candidatus ainarchaeum sp.]|nr:hypothetical protein [Candidatus ainarchaeum sp.]
MVFLELFFGLIDFLKFVIPLSIIMFIICKLFDPLRKKIVEKYNFSWIKSCLLLNLIIIFILIFSFYMYFVFIGASLAFPTEPELEYNFLEFFLMICLALIRILIVTIILSIVLLFFEFFSSFIIENQKEKQYSDIIKIFIGIFSSVSLFLFLLFFFFNWVPLGLFVYIFYGVVSEPPLLTIINVLKPY